MAVRRLAEQASMLQRNRIDGRPPTGEYHRAAASARQDPAVVEHGRDDLLIERRRSDRSCPSVVWQVPPRRGFVTSARHIGSLSETVGLGPRLQAHILSVRCGLQRWLARLLYW